MKKMPLLYGVTILFVIGFLIVVIGHTTDTRSIQPPSEQAPVEATTKPTPPTVKKKPCDCCADRLERLRIQIQQARERRKSRSSIETTNQVKSGNEK